MLGPFGIVKWPDVVLASKFAPLPFRTTAKSVLQACEGSVKRLGGRPIDLYQIHFPGSCCNAAYWDGMAMAYERGLVKAIGVSNYGVDATKAVHDALAKRGIPLASTQIQYNLLYQFPEENGLLQACNDLGVQVLSYSPLALGLLTGKYDAESAKKIRGPRREIFGKMLPDPQYRDLLISMHEVAKSHSSVEATLPQVAINWCRAKGTIPIPGARNIRQVESNFASLNWTMSQEEVEFLDKAAAGLAYLDPSAKPPYPQFDESMQLRMFDS